MQAFKRGKATLERQERLGEMERQKGTEIVEHVVGDGNMFHHGHLSP